MGEIRTILNSNFEYERRVLVNIRQFLILPETWERNEVPICSLLTQVCSIMIVDINIILYRFKRNDILDDEALQPKDACTWLYRIKI